MSLPTLSDDISYISKLGDNPNTDDGLTAAQLKAEFDKAGNKIKEYLNNTLIAALESALAAQISLDDIPDYLITAIKIDPTATWPGSLASNSVDTDQLAGGAVETAKIDDGAVTTAKIDDGAVTTDKIDDAAVTAAKIGSDVTYSTIGLNSNQVRKIFAGTDTPVVPVEGEEPDPGEFFLEDGAIYLQYEEEE